MPLDPNSLTLVNEALLVCAVIFLPLLNIFLGSEYPSLFPLALEGAGLFDLPGAVGLMKLGPLGSFGAILYLFGG